MTLLGVTISPIPVALVTLLLFDDIYSALTTGFNDMIFNCQGCYCIRRFKNRDINSTCLSISFGITLVVVYRGATPIALRVGLIKTMGGGSLQ